MNVDVAKNLHEVLGNLPKEVRLVAISKYHPNEYLETAYNEGQRIFGESHEQELAKKQETLPKDIEWHFIGPLQSNKSRLVAEHFDWCHTIDRLRIATRLNDQRPAELPPLNVLIQINISDENSKSGIQLAELDELAAAVAELPRLRLRGLMAIPAPESEYVRQFAVAQQMAVAFKALQCRYPDVDTLSLGMTDDMEAAIAAGSTMVRIGTAIFGARDYSQRQGQ